MIVECRPENRRVVTSRFSVRLDMGSQTLKNDSYLQTSSGHPPNEARQSRRDPQVRPAVLNRTASSYSGRSPSSRMVPRTSRVRSR